MQDRDWRTVVRDSATLWLIAHDETAVGTALWRSRIIGIRRLETGHLGMKLAVDSEGDMVTLARATRSWTDDEMPGPLDKALEYSVPGADWPVFAFEIAPDPSYAAS